MNDHELLELAAKAAGINLVYDGAFMSSIDEGLRFWNPLTDDGDALRLAVKLHIDVTFAGDFTVVNDVEVSTLGNDPYAATRRAIVRAAAEIWRTM